MKRYLVVGSPIAHSLSPVIMRRALDAAGIDASYEAREIPLERFPEAMRECFHEGVAGMNVTRPLKQAALAGAIEVEEEARRCGAANVLLRREEGWCAANTDGPGFSDWVESLGLARAAQEESLVLGAGGAARAVARALARLGCPRVRVANRTLSRAEELCRFSGREELRAEPLGAAAAPEGGLVVNCTSLGLRGEDPLPLPAERLRGAAAVLDAVYPETPLVRAARGLGLRAEDGLGLLVQQGCRAFHLWTGRESDPEAMLEAARTELDRRRSSPPA